MNHEAVSSMDFCEPTTVCLAETSLLTPEPSDFSKDSDSGSPGPEEDEKKPAKKRKSWGQELPTPKTNLPPRKRAKTEDEKEQRRIERVLRNRQAAQSSRERKRQEVEKLEGERDVIHQQNHLLRQRLLKVEEEKFKLKQELAEMRALLKKHTGTDITPSATPSPTLRPEVFQASQIKQELDELPLLFDASSSSQPATIDTFSSLTPESCTSSPVDSPVDAASSGMAQHPAEMLCGLPCQPEEASHSRTSPRWPREGTRLDRQQLATLQLFLTIHSTVCSTLLSPLCQLLVSLKKGSRLKTRTVTPSLFTLILWLISTPTSPIRAATTSTQPTTSTTTSTTTTTLLPTRPSTSSPSMTRSSTFRTSLLRRLLSCSPALARPLKDATARALHMKASYALRESPDRSCQDGEKMGEGEAGQSVGGVSTSPASKSEIWRLMTVALVIDQFEKQRATKQQNAKKEKAATTTAK